MWVVDRAEMGELMRHAFFQLITVITPRIEEAIAPSKQVTIIVASKSHNERIFQQVCLRLIPNNLKKLSITCINKANF